MLLISTHIDTNFRGNFNQNYHVNWWKDHTYNTCHELSNQNDALEQERNSLMSNNTTMSLYGIIDALECFEKNYREKFMNS